MAPQLKDPRQGPAILRFFQEYKKIVNSDPCIVCGGFGHQQGPECPSVGQVIECLIKLGFPAEADYFKKEFTVIWNNFYNKALFELNKQRKQQLKNDAALEQELLTKEDRKKSNRTQKKLERKIEAARGEEHKKFEEFAAKKFYEQLTGSGIDQNAAKAAVDLLIKELATIKGDEYFDPKTP